MVTLTLEIDNQNYAKKLIAFLQDISYVRTIKQSSETKSVDIEPVSLTNNEEYEKFASKLRGILKHANIDDNWKEERVNYLENKHK